MSSRFIAQLGGGERSFVARQIAGETLIMPVSGRVMDLESIYVMNDVGSRIWELLQSPTSVDRIAETLASEFAVSPERAAEDVAEFIASLDERGLVRQLTE
jgi:Coenzyme PQQ synthesis protein D (PqqD)